MSALLELRGVAKRYPSRRDDRWALRELDLDVQPGEVVAVIGRNGAGKSTLLKLACGVSPATLGVVRRPRRVAPLIEVGAGFHPELTGRENVGINGRLLGLTKGEVAAAFDDIVDFAELRHVIDEPVKTYSSGMFMRLGFAVAVHTNPELLLVDEVLAVGDLPFQVKCLDRIKAMRASGVGVLFVSHNLAAVLSLADRALLLERGEVRASGEPRDVVAGYHELLAVGVDARQVGEDAGATGDVVVLGSRALDSAGEPQLLWDPGDLVRIELTLQARCDVPESVVGLRVHKEGAGLIATYLGFEAARIPAMRAGEQRTIEVQLNLNVAEGTYPVDVAIGTPDVTVVYVDQEVARLAVAARPGGGGLVDVAPQVVLP
jgi:ABC-type polysaccharide/polyol phosphate transport system ATPase subunit